MLPRLDPGRDALLLDLDGTLIDIAITPDAVTVPSGLVETLGRLHDRLSGAVAIVTGRRVADADAMLAPLRLPISGSHGTELRLQSGTNARRVAPALAPALRREMIDLAQDDSGLVIEDKVAVVAVHYRQRLDLASRLHLALRDMIARHEADVLLTSGRDAFEIMPRGFCKATAVRALRSQAPFSGRRMIFIGDDAPDVGAMAEARAHGGIGLGVAGALFSVESAAFRDPGHVRAWLALELERVVSRPVRRRDDGGNRAGRAAL